MPFVGRDDHRSELASALDASLAGRGATLVVVEGEAGIGKSAIVEEVLRPRREDVRWAKADELASRAPFVTLTTALGISLSSTSDEILDQMADLLSVGRLVLVLDDAQWLDPGTLLLLGRALDELAEHPLAVVLPMRPLPHRRELAALVARRTGRTHVVLPPMPRQELEELIEASPIEVDVSFVPLDAVGGNPLYALELAEAIAGEGTGAPGSAPPLSVTILRRLSYLADTTLGVLRTAALLGAAFDLEDLVLVSDVGADVVLAGVEEATMAGVLRSRGDGFHFSHDLVRSALYEDIPEAIRRFEHRRIGRALADAGRLPTIVANHFDRASVPGDPEAIEWLRRAALAVGERSAEASLDLLRRALLLEPAELELRHQLTAELTVQLGRMGRFDEVIEVAQRALSEDVSDDVSVLLTVGLAQALNGRGRAREACEVLEARAADAPVAHRARLVGMLATTRLSNGDVAAARRAADEAAQAAREAGSTQWLRSSMTVQSWLATGAGDPLGGIRLAESAIDPSENDPYAAVFNQLALGAALLEADRIDAAASSFRIAVDEAESSGVEANVTLAHLGLGLCAYASGNLEDAADAAETALALAEAKGNRTSDLYAAGLRARIALHRSGPSGAAASIADARTRLEAAGPALGAELVVWAVAAYEEAAGGPVDIGLLSLTWELHPMRYLLTWRMVAPDLVRLAVQNGQGDLAANVVADVAAVAGAGVPGRDTVLARCRALASGQPDAIPPVDSTRPLEAAVAHVEAARVMLAAGERDRAIERLRTAHAAYADLGAFADADGVAELARRHRIRLAAPVRNATKPTLTAVERRVARLAATGVTNRAIANELAMSRHTVDTHLRHVYRKLGITGRVELARHPDAE